MNVGQSKVKTWRQCRQAYHYKFNEELQPRRVERPFTFGKIIHLMIEAHGQEDDPFELLDEVAKSNAKLFAEEIEEYGDIVGDIRVIMTEYFEFWPKDSMRLVPVKDETGEYRYAEHEFDVPLEALVPKRRRREVDGIHFKGQIDGLAKTPNKLRWILENKSFKSLPGDDERWRNLQTVVYAFAVRHLGWLREVDGVMWNYVCSKSPTVPETLKAGGLSSRKIVTLPTVVLAKLKELKLNPSGYVALIDRAEDSRRDYFQRIFTPLNETIAQNIFSGFIDSAIEMRDYGEKRKDKNIGRHCGWCPYELLCRTELTGGDVDFVKEKDYRHEDPEAYRRTNRLKVLR